MPPPNTDVATTIAKVPFCNPHSIVIVLRWAKPVLKSLAIKNAINIIKMFKAKVINPAWEKYKIILSFSERTAPINTIEKRTVDIFLAIGSNEMEKLEINFLKKIPQITGMVTIPNIWNAMFEIDIETEDESSRIKLSEPKIIIGIVKTQRRLIIAVNETDNATSPLAKEVIMLDVAPPGAAAINITPMASSGDNDGQNKTRSMATIGNIIIWEKAPIRKSFGCCRILLKSLIVSPKPKENIIKAKEKGRKISEIKPINYYSIRFSINKKKYKIHNFIW